MIILAVGMPRAGSGWHYNLVHDLVVASGGQDAREIRRRFLLQPILTEVNCNIRTLSLKRLLPVLVPSRLGNTFAIKTHSGPTSMALRMMRNRQMRVTYIYRDPRGALLSAIEYGQRARAAGRQNVFSELATFEDALKFMKNYLRIWSEWMAIVPIHSLRYEDLLANYDAEAGRLATFLNADPAQPDVKEAIEFYRSEHGAKGAKAETKGLHFQHGQAERFREALTPAELEQASQAFAPYLAQMGYAA
jgi:hypothetical protein